MYTLELIVKGNPAPLGIQKKEEEEAQQLFRQVVESIKTGDVKSMELTCDRTGRQLLVLISEVIAVQLTPKGGPAGQTMTRPGFLAG
ncbi:MAG: hypothetical protein ACFCU9_05055 [Cyanophyceae cyanobacterium]|jgi:hypothetical protein